MTTLPIATILKLTCNQLRSECNEANLDSTGKKADLQQRLINHHLAQNNNDENKENNSPVPAPKTKTKFQVADLVCPITLELPFDPVTAEDGRVYERSAILNHIATQNNGVLKSPMTNAPMGDRLLPALQHKNLIEALIKEGVLKGDLVSSWNEKVKEKKFKEDLIKKANNGDTVAMHHVGLCHRVGLFGFKRDDQLAYSFFVKGHDAGDVRSTMMVGQRLFIGDGVEKWHERGLSYLSLAAGKGSKLAAWILALSFAYGNESMKVDKEEAIRWSRMALEAGGIDDLVPEDVKQAQELLDKLTADVATTN